MPGIDPNSIGQDRAVQDPQDAINAATGVYKDSAAALPQTETIDYMPKVELPTPFNITGGAKGSR